MRTHRLIVEITTTTDIPLNLTVLQGKIMEYRKDAYVTVSEKA